MENCDRKRQIYDMKWGNHTWDTFSQNVATYRRLGFRFLWGKSAQGMRASFSYRNFLWQSIQHAWMNVALEGSYLEHFIHLFLKN
jgi:hypothetical protein